MFASFVPIVVEDVADLKSMCCIGTKTTSSASIGLKEFQFGLPRKKKLASKVYKYNILFILLGRVIINKVI